MKNVEEKILSVSVACYNLGEMIETNIKSFCESKYAKNIELIITDDESKDNTIEIVEKYVKKYPDIIKLIKQKNAGPGSTVNSGIKNATGKYFRMVDGDDWVNTDNLNGFIEYLRNCDSDMVISDYDIYDNITKEVVNENTCKLEPENTFVLDECYNLVPNCMHQITFKTEIFKNNKIVLDNCFYTDVEFVLLPMLYVKTVSYYNKSIYVYRVAQANQSVSPEKLKRNINQHERVLNRLIDYYNQNKHTFSIGQKEFVGKRIAIMCDTNLQILLTLEPEKANKERVRNFVRDIKGKCLDVYNSFKKSKKCKLLIWSNYLLYPLVCKIVRKKQ